jgi:hypothetical protein
MQIQARLLAAALAALPLAGCGAGDALSPDGAMFVATVQGSVQDSYRGTGQFQASSGDGTHPGIFTIFSHDLLGGQSFLLFREGMQVPQPGSYPLTTSVAGPLRFGASYTRRQGGVMEGYTATSGELVISTSIRGWIKGTFRFHGTRNCAGTESGISCTYPLDPGAPSVEVTGSFAAVGGGTLPSTLF